MTVSNRIIAIAIAAVLFLILLFNSFFIVNEREQAIVLRFGQIQDVENEPGLYFKAPFSFAGFDNVKIIEDRLLLAELDDIRVQTSGGRFYIVNAFITYQIANPTRFQQVASGDLDLAENRLTTRFEDAVRGVYGQRGFEAALSEARAEMMREVTARLAPEAERLGLELEDVRIRRTDLTPEVSEQTFARMRSEREAEAERLRARGNEAAQRIRARAQRQVVDIESDAVRESEILRGEGEGERNRIFAEAFTQDPQFFEFYRSMEAYRRALEGGQGTRMVLTPNSEFFRFFQDAGEAAVGAALPASLTPPTELGNDDLATDGDSSAGSDVEVEVIEPSTAGDTIGTNPTVQDDATTTDDTVATDDTANVETTIVPLDDGAGITGADDTVTVPVEEPLSDGTTIAQ